MSSFTNRFPSRVALFVTVALVVAFSFGKFSAMAKSSPSSSASALANTIVDATVDGIVEDSSDPNVRVAPRAMPLSPMMLVFNVDRLDDPSPAAAFSACTAAANDCSLLGAVLAANLVPGSTIVLGAGTHVLSIAGNDALSNLGDLDIRGNNTQIIGAGAGVSIIRQTVTDRVIEVNPTIVAGFNFTISGVTVTGGNLTAGSGAGILGGANLNSLVVSNCEFTGNSARANGGAISFSANSVIPMTVTDSTFSNNTAVTGVGGAISYSGSGALLVQRSSFTANAASANSGGAINATSLTGAGTFTISQSTFVNNQAGGAGRGGAINKGSGLLNLSYSRLVGNTAAIAANGNHVAVIVGSTGATTLDDNWWGLNSGPGANGIANGMATTWLQLRLAASSTDVCPGDSASLDADIYGRNMGGPVLGCPGVTCPLNGLASFPIPPGTIFTASNGTISAASTQFVNGAASATYTATSGAGGASATADSETVSVTITLGENSTTDPADQTVCEGANVSFSTTTSGNGPFSYVWKQGATVLNNGDLGGRVTITSAGNSSTLSISSVQPGDAAVYTVEATGQCDTDTQSATLTVHQKTTTSDPADQTVCQGATANFSTTAGGTGPFSYSWTVDGSPAGGNSPNLAVDTTALSVGNHTVSVTTTGACGSASQSATLTVQENTATTDPADQTVCQGATANFSTTASGTGPFTYSWTVDGSPAGTNSPNLSVDTTSLSVGNHTVAVSVSGGCGTAVQSASLTVQENTSTTDPADQTVCEGATANFSTTASGTGPFTYSWTVDGSPAGGNSPNLSVDTTGFSSGNHTVAVTVSGTCGSASQSATLTVNANTTTTDPADQTVCQGATANFSTTAGGTSPFSYSWTVDGSPAGGNSPNLSVDTTSLSVGNHTVAVTTTGACGSASQSATLTVNANTTTTDPADQTVCQGATANFSTTASGTGPFSYSWTVDGSPAGTNSPNLSVNTTSMTPGNHTVAVTTTGACGSASQSATLTVNATTATTDPADQSVCGGATASFTTTASGTGPFSFVWKKGLVVLNNGDLGGRVTITNTSTTSTLSISNAQGSDAGTYTVETTGACGTASQSANLSVDTAPPTLVLNPDAEMWPPNHAYQTFNVSSMVASANDGCDGNVINNVVITSVSSDETENGNGDGNTFNDIVIAANCKSVNLRAERQTSGNGRVYRINLRVTDSQGNTTTATYRVSVRKTQNGSPAVDDGPGAGYTVISSCP